MTVENDNGNFWVSDGAYTIGHHVYVRQDNPDHISIETDPEYPIALSRKLVAELIPLLQRFVETGRLGE